MRILPVGADHGRGVSAQANAPTDRRRHRQSYDEHLSLRDLSAYRGRHSSGGRAEARGGRSMGVTENVAKTAMDRRDFLASTGAVGGALVLGFHLPSAKAHAAAIEGQPWYRDASVPEINAWL